MSRKKPSSAVYSTRTPSTTSAPKESKAQENPNPETADQTLTRLKSMFADFEKPNLGGASLQKANSTKTTGNSLEQKALSKPTKITEESILASLSPSKRAKPLDARRFSRHLNTEAGKAAQ